MAFMTSLMWALYKLKPGVPTCLSPGAGSAGAGAGAGGMNISSPRTTSNLGAVQAASAGGGGAGAGSGASAGSGSGALASKVTVVNGSASGKVIFLSLQFFPTPVFCKNTFLNPFPNKPWFLSASSTSLLKTLWEKEKLLVMSNFSFSRSVFYQFGELSAIFIKLKMVVCKLFEFGRI